MKYTERSLRIIKNAEAVAEQTSQYVLPVHLLLGALQERTGVCGELFLHFPTLYETIYEGLMNLEFANEGQGILYEPFGVAIAHTTEQVMVHAQNKMIRFNQIYINEGHILNALFHLRDPLTRSLTDGIETSRILEITSYPRDLIVSLNNYSFPKIQESEFIFRRAEIKDHELLNIFIEKEYGTGWLIAVDNGFSKRDIPIYIALENSTIIGFACYDVVRNKKGLFGPMGTALSKRKLGVGYTLLHLCLKAMKETGYEYAVIGNAGPIEFYEKSCNAAILPLPFDHR